MIVDTQNVQLELMSVFVCDTSHEEEAEITPKSPSNFNMLASANKHKSATEAGGNVINWPDNVAK